MLLLDFGGINLKDRYLKGLANKTKTTCMSTYNEGFVRIDCMILWDLLNLPSLPLSLIDLSIPILVPFSVYQKPMLECDSMKVSAVVTDKQNPDNPYLAEDDVVLLDPPISVTVSGNLCLSVYLSLKSPVVCSAVCHIS